MEEKQRDGTIEWHGELPDEISHEGYISDGEHCLHAWFAAECFRPAVVAPAIQQRLTTADGAAYLVHEKAVVEVIDWWYRYTDTLETPREWGHIYSGCVACLTRVCKNCNADIFVHAGMSSSLERSDPSSGTASSRRRTTYLGRWLSLGCRSSAGSITALTPRGGTSLPGHG